MSQPEISPGDLVRARCREWMVEGVRVLGTDQRSIALDLACIDDDAQGQRLSAVVGAEIDFRRVEDDLWAQIAREGTDDPEVFSAHLRAVTWRSADPAGLTPCSNLTESRRVL